MTTAATPFEATTDAEPARCPVAHAAPPAPAPPAASGCPVAHHAPATPAASGCPVAHGAPMGPIHRSRADELMRAALRVKEPPADRSQAATYRSFQRSMAISATRCTLTYVIFPFVLPAVGFATGVGPMIGITIGVLAIVCDVFTVRRFFAVDHRYRWAVTAVAAGVIGLLSVLLVQDISHLVT